MQRLHYCLFILACFQIVNMPPHGVYLFIITLLSIFWLNSSRNIKQMKQNSCGEHLFFTFWISKLFASAIKCASTNKFILNKGLDILKEIYWRIVCFFSKLNESIFFMRKRSIVLEILLTAEWYSNVRRILNAFMFIEIIFYEQYLLKHL
jgi:hypothetical protein